MGAARRLPVLPFAAGIVVGALLGWHRSTLTGAEPRSSRAEALVPALHPMRSVAARTPATVEQRGLRGAGVEEDARTRGPYYGDIEQPGELERMVRLVSLNGELVLLHGDENRLRMIVNLVAQLNGHGIEHTLLLGFTPGVCHLLERRRRIACAHSSFMTDASPRADAARRWRLAHKYVAWIQKFELMRRLVEVRVSVLALDSDVVVRADPYPHLRGAFGNYTLITAFDTKGGFARINIGVVYVQRAAVGGPVHALLVEFIARVDETLALRVPESKRERAAVVVRLFWDQNLFNKVLLSAMAGRRLYVPDDSDAEWRRAHGGEIVAAGIDLTKRAPPPHAAAWRQPTARVAAPSALTVRPPWYPRRSEYRWVELHGAPGGATPGGATPGGAGEGAGERVLLAPPWLVSADNSLGERYKHWLYGARPTPCVMLHFVCVAAGEESRLLPMRLFGDWHAGAVNAELAGTHLANDSATVPSTAERTAPSAVPLGAPRRLIAFERGSYAAPLTPRPWAQLNAMHALLGGLARLSKRTPVAPALDCTGVGDGFLEPGTLPSRCFWHVHTAHGVRCVFRMGKCSHRDVAMPAELDEALAQQQQADGRASPPTIHVDMRANASSSDAADAVRSLLRAEARAAPVVLLSLRLPEREQERERADGAGDARRAHSPVHDGIPALLSAERLARVNPRLPGAVQRFGRACPELLDRSKRRRRECTNVC